MSWWAWLLIGIVAAIVLMCLAGYIILRYLTPPGDLALKSKRSVNMGNWIATHKIVIGDIVAGAIGIANQVIGQGLYPKYNGDITLGILIITAIANMIGVSTVVTMKDKIIAGLKAKLGIK
jgi:hypothetical protein